MSRPTRGEFTEQLGRALPDERAQLDHLFRVVYEELLQIARRQMVGAWGKQTLDTSGLVHEAYLKLVDARRVTQKGRAYFFGAAARAMRQILVDASRRRNRVKRGGEGNVHTDLDEATLAVDDFAAEIVALNDGLESLARIMPRPAKVIEYRFFGGMSIEEVADALDLSSRTVLRDWMIAKAWLYRELVLGDLGHEGKH